MIVEAPIALSSQPDEKTSSNSKQKKKFVELEKVQTIGNTTPVDYESKNTRVNDKSTDSSNSKDSTDIDMSTSFPFGRAPFLLPEVSPVKKKDGQAVQQETRFRVQREHSKSRKSRKSRGAKARAKIATDDKENSPRIAQHSKQTLSKVSKGAENQEMPFTNKSDAKLLSMEQSALKNTTGVRHRRAVPKETESLTDMSQKSTCVRVASDSNRSFSEILNTWFN